MSALEYELYGSAGAHLFEIAECVNDLVESLSSGWRITVSFKDAPDETSWIMGTVIRDIYDCYPESLIDELLRIEDLSPFGAKECLPAS
jgi:hypothetical protein